MQPYRISFIHYRSSDLAFDTVFNEDGEQRNQGIEINAFGKVLFYCVKGLSSLIPQNRMVKLDLPGIAELRKWQYNANHFHSP